MRFADPSGSGSVAVGAANLPLAGPPLQYEKQEVLNRLKLSDVQNSQRRKTMRSKTRGEQAKSTEITLIPSCLKD